MNDIEKKHHLFMMGLKLFNDKQFYDAHEYWEELWLEYHLQDKKKPSGSNPKNPINVA